MNLETGHTTCVWTAPAREDVESLFKTAGVKLKSVVPVEERTAAGAT